MYILYTICSDAGDSKEEGEDEGDDESPATGEATADETAPAALAAEDVKDDTQEQKGDDSATAPTSLEEVVVKEAVTQEVVQDADKPEVSASEDLPLEGVEEPSSEVAAGGEDGSSDQPAVQEAESSSAATAGESTFNYPDAEEGEEVEPHLHAPQSLGAQAQNQPAYAIVMVEKPGGGVRSQYIPLQDRYVLYYIFQWLMNESARSFYHYCYELVWTTGALR